MKDDSQSDLSMDSLDRIFHRKVLLPIYEKNTKESCQKSSQSVIMLPLAHFILLILVRNAFFGSPLSILLTYQPFQPLSLCLYFQLLEESGLKVDQSTWSYSKALTHSHKTIDVIDVLNECTNMQT